MFRKFLYDPSRLEQIVKPKLKEKELDDLSNVFVDEFKRQEKEARDKQYAETAEQKRLVAEAEAKANEWKKEYAPAIKLLTNDVWIESDPRFVKMYDQKTMFVVKKTETGKMRDGSHPEGLPFVRSSYKVLNKNNLEKVTELLSHPKLGELIKLDAISSIGGGSKRSDFNYVSFSRAYQIVPDRSVNE